MNAWPTAGCPGIEVGQAGVLLANMLADWLEEKREQSLSMEAADEFHDQRAASGQDGVCLCAAVDDGGRFVIIRRAPSGSMLCGRRRWSWAVASLRFRSWTAIWARREHR